VSVLFWVRNYGISAQLVKAGFRERLGAGRWNGKKGVVESKGDLWRKQEVWFLRKSGRSSLEEVDALDQVKA